MKVRFTADYSVPQGVSYKKDQVVDFNGPVEVTYARKYINRGIAVDVEAEAKEAAAASAKTPPAAPEKQSGDPLGGSDGKPLGIKK